jgi:hypothetical protein
MVAAMDAEDADNGSQDVLDETRRLLIQQEAGLDTLRGRSAALLTVAAVIAGLFAPRISTHDHWRAAMLVVSLMLFASTASLVISIQLPRKLVFAHDMSRWIDAWRTGHRPSHRDLAYNLSRDFTDYRRANAPIIARLQTMFTATCALVALQVLKWGSAAL